MTTKQDKSALRIAKEVDCLPMQSRDQWAKEFARRLLAWERERAEPVGVCLRTSDGNLYLFTSIDSDDHYKKTAKLLDQSVVYLYAVPAAQDALEARREYGEMDDYRTCEFCGCRTNAKLRHCCDKGHDADAMRAKEDGHD